MARSMKEMAAAATEWIRARVEEAGVEGALVGLSGGVDSAVVAGLLKRALGGKSLGVVMPCESDPQDAEDASAVARAFDLETVTVELDAAFETLYHDLAPPLAPPSQSLQGGLGAAKRRAVLMEAPALARANLKPRLRMTVLYYYANTLSYLVAGAGNRTEIMLGYFTKFGDGGADILPLGGLLKRDVRELARELGVPEAIIERPPSAGLWKGQTDEAEIGMSYDEIDRALACLIGADARDLQGCHRGKRGKRDQTSVSSVSSVASLPRGAADAAVIERVKRLVAASAHKRAPAPVFEP